MKWNGFCSKVLRRTVVLLGVFLGLLPGVVFADEVRAYRLVQGDVLQITHPASETPRTLEVDLDGNLRLPEIAPILVTGLTLDETAAVIRKEIQKTELFIDPQVTVSIRDYAPVLVAGDVNRPGEIGYVPGLTIAAALALSSGLKSETPLERDRARAYVHLTGQIDGLDLEIAADSGRLQALKLALNTTAYQSSTWQKSEGWRNLTADNRAWFAAHLDKLAVSLDVWSREADAVKSRMALLRQRIELQRAKTVIANREIVDAEALKAKGLQTSARVAGLQRREADTRSDLLELESALVTASIALIQVQARRDRHLAERKAALLEDIHATQQDLLKAEMLRDNLVAQLQSLGPMHGGWQAINAGRLSFRILSLRANRADLTSPGPETLLLPGDTLIVRTVGSDTSYDG